MDCELVQDKIQTELVEQSQLTHEQIAEVSERLKETAEASERMGRKDWLIYLLGTITALIITATVTAGIGENIFTIVITALANLSAAERPMAPLRLAAQTMAMVGVRLVLSRVGRMRLLSLASSASGMTRRPTFQGLGLQSSRDVLRRLKVGATSIRVDSETMLAFEFGDLGLHRFGDSNVASNVIWSAERGNAVVQFPTLQRINRWSDHDKHMAIRQDRRRVPCSFS